MLSCGKGGWQQPSAFVRFVMKIINRSAAGLALFLSTMFCGILVSGQNGPEQAIKAADDLYKTGKWREAISAYEQIVKADPGNAVAWHQLAMSRYSLKEWDAAIAAFQKCITLRD